MLANSSAGNMDNTRSLNGEWRRATKGSAVIIARSTSTGAISENILLLLGVVPSRLAMENG